MGFLDTAPQITGAAAQAAANGPAPTAVGKGSSPAEIKKASQDFETFFAQQMLQEMFKDVKADGVFGGGHGEEMFKPFLLDEYAKSIGKNGNLGIGKMVMGALIKQQQEQAEGADPLPAASLQAYSQAAAAQPAAAEQAAAQPSTDKQPASEGDGA